MNSRLFELGPVCWPQMLMAKAKYCIKQRQNRLWIPIYIFASSKIRYNFEIDCNDPFERLNLRGTKATDNLTKADFGFNNHTKTILL